MQSLAQNFNRCPEHAVRKTRCQAWNFPVPKKATNAMPTTDQKGKRRAVNPGMKGSSGWRDRVPSPRCAGVNGLFEPHQPIHWLRWCLFSTTGHPNSQPKGGGTLKGAITLFPHQSKQSLWGCGGCILSPRLSIKHSVEYVKPQTTPLCYFLTVSLH